MPDRKALVSMILIGSALALLATVVAAPSAPRASRPSRPAPTAPGGTSPSPRLGRPASAARPRSTRSAGPTHSNPRAKSRRRMGRCPTPATPSRPPPHVPKPPTTTGSSLARRRRITRSDADPSLSADGPAALSHRLGSRRRCAASPGRRSSPRPPPGSISGRLRASRRGIAPSAVDSRAGPSPPNGPRRVPGDRIRIAATWPRPRWRGTCRRAFAIRWRTIPRRVAVPKDMGPWSVKRAGVRP